MSQQQIELSYDQQGIPWHRKRSVQRWAIGAVLLIAAACLIHSLPPIWQRYEYYRLQSRAANYPETPQKVALQYSATQPYRHAAGPMDHFLADLQTAAFAWQHATVSFTGVAGSTPIFCGARTARGGHRAIVQIYASVTQSVAESNLSIIAVSSNWRGWQWVFKPGPDLIHSGQIGGGVGQITLRIDGKANAALFGGAANQIDPSETDIKLFLDSQPYTLKFHLIEVTSSRPPQLGIALDQSVLRQLFGPMHGFNGIGIWWWPFTAK